MNELCNDKCLTNIFTKRCHHLNLSYVFIVQNMFCQGKELRTISLNTHYMFIFKSHWDSSQITHLAKQMYPGNLKFMQRIWWYHDATTKPYWYLLCDLKPEMPYDFRLRTNICPEETQYAYIHYQQKTHEKAVTFFMAKSLYFNGIIRGFSWCHFMAFSWHSHHENGITIPWKTCENPLNIKVFMGHELVTRTGETMKISLKCHGFHRSLIFCHSMKKWWKSHENLRGPKFMESWVFHGMLCYPWAMILPWKCTEF